MNIKQHQIINPPTTLKTTIHTLTITTLLMWGCQPTNQQTSNEESVITKTKKEISPRTQGRQELQAFEEKYEKKWTEKPSEFPYSKGHHYKAFRLECKAECFKSEFRHRASHGIDVTEANFLELVALLKNPDSYGSSVAACYHPEIGVVVYDDEGVPMESLGMCLTCNRFESQPGSVGFLEERRGSTMGFSPATRDSLRAIFQKWGIEYNMISSMFDGEEKYMRYIEQKHKASEK